MPCVCVSSSIREKYVPSKTDTALARQGSLFPILVGSGDLARGSKEAAVIEGGS